MEPQETPSQAAPQTATQVSSLKGLAAVFYAPAKWFEELQAQPKVLVPYIVLGILLLVLFYGMGDVIVEMQLNTPEMREQMENPATPANMEQILWYSTVGGGTLAFLLGPLVAAVLALFWGNVVFAGYARFKALLSVVLYGEILWAVGGLLVLPLVLAKQSLAVGFNLGTLVAERGLEDPLYLALSKLDLFLIWEIIVVGIGLAVIYRFSRNKGILLSVLSVGMLSVVQVLIQVVKSLL